MLVLLIIKVQRPLHLTVVNRQMILQIQIKSN